MQPTSLVSKKVAAYTIVPVLMSFFVMSFCDLVGIATDRVKQDFGLSHTLAQLLPSAVFIWFLLLAVPVGVWQDKLGKRRVLSIGIALTAMGLLIPMLHYSFPMVLLAFGLLGIGNTIVQVSANPLLVDVAPPHRQASLLSFSQFIKAVGSMAAAPLTGWLALQFGNWKLMFPVFALVSILNMVWLLLTPVQESRQLKKRASVASSFGLLRKGWVLAMVAGIFLLVGIDVGINSLSGQYLLHAGMEQGIAESGRSFYFFGKMAGTFIGAILLTRVAARYLLLASAVLGLLAFAGFLLLPAGYNLLLMLLATGLGLANIFPLIFSWCADKMPNRTNEIAGLVIMAVTGGAVLPVLTGWVSDVFSLTAGMLLLGVCFLYLLILSIYAYQQ